jgi:hypothetical protein
MANSSSKTKNSNKSKSNKSGGIKNASGWGCFLLIAGGIAWVALLILGPISLLDALDRVNNPNTLANGPVTSVGTQTVDSNSFNILTINASSGSVQAAVPPPVYSAAQQYCNNSAKPCYAEAEFEDNDGLFKLKLYLNQGGPLLASVANHSQEQDDVDLAIALSIAFAVVTVLWVIYYVVPKPQKAAKSLTPSQAAAITAAQTGMAAYSANQMNWAGGWPPQGGVSSEGKWMVPPPSAVQIAAGTHPAQMQSSNQSDQSLPPSSWPSIQPPK